MIKKIFLCLVLGPLAAVLIVGAGTGYLAVGHALVAAEQRVYKRKYSGPPFVQAPQGFLENFVTARNTIPVLGKQDRFVARWVVMWWPVYYIGGTALMWTGAQIVNASDLAESVAGRLGST